MHAHDKGLCLFGIIAFLVLALLLLFWYRGATGAAIQSCPAGFVNHNDECAEPACKEKGIYCVREDGVRKRPDCACMTEDDAYLCGFKHSEKTSFKSPLCTRRGQLERVCGSLDTRIKRCVPNPLIT